MSDFKDFLKLLVEKKDKILKIERINVVREQVGYSEYTQWMTTVSFDTIQTIDFDALIEEIDKFSKIFEEDH